MPNSTIGEQFAALWGEYLAACRAHTQALAALREKECSILPGEYYVLAINIDDHAQEIRKAAKDTVGRLVDHAARQFAPAGARLEIDTTEIQEKFDFGKNPEQLDLAAVWAHLGATYGGTKGEDEAYRQAATALVRAFGLERSPEIKRKAGFVVLDLRVWPDSFDKKLNNVTRLSYGCVERVMDVHRTLGTFARWAGRDQAAHDLNAGARRWWDNKAITSRERIGFGDKGADVELVTYSTRFEFRISNALAAQLQVFIGTYAAAMMMREAA